MIHMIAFQAQKVISSSISSNVWFLSCIILHQIFGFLGHFSPLKSQSAIYLIIFDVFDGGYENKIIKKLKKNKKGHIIFLFC